MGQSIHFDFYVETYRMTIRVIYTLVSKGRSSTLNSNWISYDSGQTPIHLNLCHPRLYLYVYIIYLTHTHIAFTCGPPSYLDFNTYTHTHMYIIITFTHKKQIPSQYIGVEKQHQRLSYMKSVETHTHM